jgi:YesN/AraC family two-component response regulator
MAVKSRSAAGKAKAPPLRFACKRETGILHRNKANSLYAVVSGIQLPELSNNGEIPAIPPVSKYNILIVEDDNSLRALLAEVFETFCFVRQALSGNEALEKIALQKPDIILSDIVMPGISGIELCKRIKNNFDTCHIPVVLLTAKAAIEHTLDGLNVGADDYITKPFNVNILISRCNNLVMSRILLQEKFGRQPQADTNILVTNHLDEKFMNKIVSIVKSRLKNEHFSIDDLAAEAGIARTKLFVKLKEITGQTPHDFITTIRLKKAAFMLKNNPELNITEISEETGFSSPRYFSRCFKNKYAITPLEYRK